MINSEIQELLDKGVTVQCDREPNDFVSTVFTREKKDGSSRTILNLKHLNEFVNYRHFEMESLTDVLTAIKKDVRMAPVLKDAFFTIPAHKSHQKYFKFEWFQNFHKFLGSMPNGYSDAMRIFTKILKPVY